MEYMYFNLDNHWNEGEVVYRKSKREGELSKKMGNIYTIKENKQQQQQRKNRNH